MFVSISTAPKRDYLIAEIKKLDTLKKRNKYSYWQEKSLKFNFSVFFLSLKKNIGANVCGKSSIASPYSVSIRGL